MSLAYFVSSLPPVPFDGPAPLSAETFIAECRRWMRPRDAAAIEAALAPGGAIAADSGRGHPLLERWRDLETQMRNAAAQERARLRNADAAKWKRPEKGCDLYWKARASAAFRESGPMARQDALDRAAWDAAESIVPPENPLGAEAAFAYAVKLAIALRRSKTDKAAGNAVFDKIAAAARTDAGGKE